MIDTGYESEEKTDSLYPEPTESSIHPLYGNGIETPEVFTLSPEMKYAFVFWTRLFLGFFAIIFILSYRDYVGQTGTRDLIRFFGFLALADFIMHLIAIWREQIREIFRTWNPFWIIIVTLVTIQSDGIRQYGAVLYPFIFLYLLPVYLEYKTLKEIQEEKEK